MSFKKKADHVVSLGMGSLSSDRSGVNQLLKFYQTCLLHSNKTVEVGLSSLSWFDGNLCSLLGALLYRLNKQCNLDFVMDAEEVAKKFDIFFHNDFLPFVQTRGVYKKTSCIPYKGFLVKQKDEFINYMENDLLNHTSMPKISVGAVDKLLDDIGEIYANIDKHAFTNDPFFVCGQFFPKSEIIKFTLCDSGVGFLPKIAALCPEITNYGQAILWAVRGNTTKPDAPGGTGLKGLTNYFAAGNGRMQIFSGDHSWCSRTAESRSVIFPDGVIPLSSHYQGAIINLEFNKKRLPL